MQSNPFKLPTKIKLLDQIADLDNDILSKLVELSKSKKAVGYIREPENWQMVISMLM